MLNFLLHQINIVTKDIAIIASIPSKLTKNAQTLNIPIFWTKHKQSPEKLAQWEKTTNSGFLLIDDLHYLENTTLGNNISKLITKENNSLKIIFSTLTPKYGIPNTSIANIAKQYRQGIIFSPENTLIGENIGFPGIKIDLTEQYPTGRATLIEESLFENNKPGYLTIQTPIL